MNLHIVSGCIYMGEYKGLRDVCGKLRFFSPQNLDVQ